VHVLGSQGTVERPAFFSSRELASDRDACFHVMCLSGGTVSHRLQGSRELVALGTENGLVVVWDIARGSIACELGQKGTGHSSRVRAVAFASQTRLFSVGDDRQCMAWDCNPASASSLARFECQSAGPALAVLPGVEGSVVTGGAQLGEWDGSGKPMRTLVGGHSAPVSLLAHVGEGSSLASSAGDRFVCVWRTGGTKDILAATQPVARLCGSANGVAAVSEDGSKVFFWRDEAESAASADQASGKGSKKSKTAASSPLPANKAREPFATLEAGNHPVLDVLWDREAALVARLVGGRPQFVRVAPSDKMPAVELQSGASGGAASRVVPGAVDGLGARLGASANSLPVPSGAGVAAGGAGTVVGILRQALLTQDEVLLGEALNAPVRPEDSCRALDSRLATPLLAALASRLERGAGDARTLEWVKALLKEHRTTIGASNEGEGTIDVLRSICDRATHSLKRLVRLRGKLDLLETAGPVRSAETRLVTWDEREASGPMDIDEEEERNEAMEDNDGNDDDDDDDEGEDESSSDASD
jgi:hypothetical protein